MDRYFDDYNPDLLPLIPPDAQVILEVGCGTGRLFEAYQRINPGVTWCGLDVNLEAVRAAMDRGIVARCVDVERDSIGDWIYVRDADALILGDILEHLRDPWKVLKSLSSYVKPGGQVLASIPNVQHWSVILNLLRGEWRYEDDGLLDRTHLRFFTLESIKEMFASAGLQTFDIRGRQIGFNPEAEAARDRLLASGFGEMFGGPEFARQTMVYQYLVRAIRPSPIVQGFMGDKLIAQSPPDVQKLHIHAIGDGTICERPRLHEPLAMLSTIPGCSFGLLGKQPQIYIQQRYRRLDIDAQRRILDDGCLIIAEIDDDPEWLVGLPECDFLPLRAVHAIQTTTEVMAETCRRFNPHVAVFPNQIADLPPPRNHAGEDHPVRIFFGALNRENDWAPIMLALNRVLAECSDFVVHVVHDRAFFDALKTKAKTFHPFCQWEEYRRILHTCDIALLPLENNRVNRHKSDIKFIECAAEGVAVLASNVIYGETNTRLACQRFFSSPAQFEEQLRWMISHPDIGMGSRRELAANAYAYVRDHRLLSQHYRRRHEWYLDLFNRREELTRDLLERVPSLCPRSQEPVLAGSRPVPAVSLA